MSTKTKSKKKDKNFVHPETVKDKFAEFLEALKGMKQCNDKRIFKQNLDWHLKGAASYYQDLMPDIDFIGDVHMRPTQKQSNDLNNALSRLTDEDLNLLSSAAIGLTYHAQTN